LAILLEDFQTAYEQVSRGEAIHLPPKTTSFKQWAERQEYLSAELQQERDYWLAESETGRSLGYSGEREHGGCGEHRISLMKETQALQQVPKAYNRLMMYCSQPWCKLLQSGQESERCWWKKDTRTEVFDDVDLSRTIGFTTIFPVFGTGRGFSS